MRSTITVLFFLVLIINPSFSQNNCEVPLPPQLNLVSAEPESSSIALYWALSPSSDVVAYIIYSFETRSGNPGFYAIDTIWNPVATSYIYKNKLYKSFQFRVAAFRLPKCASELSNILSTIFIDSRADTCNRIIELTWNKYNSSPAVVTDYSVLVSTGGGSFNEAGRVSSETTSYTLDNFMIGTEYCVEIRANLEGGINSLSNKSCITTNMLRPPDWINADFATVTGQNEVSLKFSIDPASETDLYTLEKRIGFSGSFNQIAQIRSSLKSIDYADKNADPGLISFYRLLAVNNCNIPVNSSNLASNIAVTAQNTGNEINLRWNSYRKWLGSVLSYRIFTNTGQGFSQTAITGPNDTTYHISIPDIMYSLSDNKICFYISASEAGNPYGISGISNSAPVCCEIEEVITVPNVFTPDGDLKNDLFRPVLTFTPSEYQLIISDRNGKTLFDTHDFEESWDGSVSGRVVPDGVYLWLLRITTPNGKEISRTGTLTVVKK